MWQAYKGGHILLSFGHHEKALTVKDPTERMALLKTAEESGWSVEQIGTGDNTLWCLLHLGHNKMIVEIIASFGWLGFVLDPISRQVPIPI